MTVGFAQGIGNFKKKYEARMVRLHKKVSLDLFKKVVLKTPVDTGHARGNWNFGINEVRKEVSEAATKDESMNNLITGVKGLQLGDTSVLANSVPYIGILEYGGYPKEVKYGSVGRKANKKKGITAMRQIKSVGGYSYQAPQGMVRVTVEEYQPTLKTAIALVKREIP